MTYRRETPNILATADWENLQATILQYAPVFAFAHLQIEPFIC